MRGARRDRSVGATDGEAVRTTGGVHMSRSDVEADIRETLGLVPSFWSQVPDFLMESEWQSFKALELAETEIPNEYTRS
jgi:hypothetical protein